MLVSVTEQCYIQHLPLLSATPTNYSQQILLSVTPSQLQTMLVSVTEQCYIQHLPLLRHLVCPSRNSAAESHAGVSFYSQLLLPAAFSLFTSIHTSTASCVRVSDIMGCRRCACSCTAGHRHNLSMVKRRAHVPYTSQHSGSTSGSTTTGTWPMTETRLPLETINQIARFTAIESLARYHVRSVVQCLHTSLTDLAKPRADQKTDGNKSAANSDKVSLTACPPIACAGPPATPAYSRVS